MRFSGARGRSRTGTGVASEGFSYQLRLSPRRHESKRRFVVWTFSSSYRRGDVDEGRQVSTLSGRGEKPAARLSSGLPPPLRAEVSPNLTLFTAGVSDPRAQFSQVPCVYLFHHPGGAGENIADGGRLHLKDTRPVRTANAEAH